MKQFKWMVLLLLLGSCATPYITSSWKAPETAGRSYKKIMVLGLIGDPDRSIREKIEEHIAGDLRALGYNAACSCEEYNPKTFEGLKEPEALKKLENSGVDAVLTVVLLSKTKERYYVPGRMIHTPYGMYHDNFWGYYTTMRGRVYRKGYYEINTKYFWETNLYDLDKKELLYSAQSQSFDPESSETLGHEYGKMLVKDLVKKKVIIKQP